MSENRIAAFVRERRRAIGLNQAQLEDMCQLTGKLTQDKYRSSMEQAIDATFERFARGLPELRAGIDRAWLSPATKEAYASLLSERCERLEIG